MDAQINSGPEAAPFPKVLFAIAVILLIAVGIGLIRTHKLQKEIEKRIGK